MNRCDADDLTGSSLVLYYRYYLLLISMKPSSSSMQGQYEYNNANQ